MDDPRVRVLLRELRRALVIVADGIKAALEMPAKK
jgi:hypothetical protein